MVARCRDYGEAADGEEVRAGMSDPRHPEDRIRATAGALRGAPDRALRRTRKRRTLRGDPMRRSHRNLESPRRRGEGRKGAPQRRGARQAATPAPYPGAFMDRGRT